MPRMTSARMARALSYHERQATQLRGLDGAEQWITYHDEAAARYRKMLGDRVSCQRCGRALQDPESVQRGIGPDCLTKVIR